MTKLTKTEETMLIAIWQMSKIELKDIPNDICIVIFCINMATSCYYLSYSFFDIFYE